MRGHPALNGVVEVPMFPRLSPLTRLMLSNDDAGTGGAGDDGNAPAGTAAADPPDAKFTQDDVDRIVGQRLKKLEKANTDLQQKVDDAAAASMSDDDKRLKEARDEGHQAGAAETAQTLKERILASEVKAAATDKFTDPTDALGLIDRSDLVGDDGTVDAKALGERLDGLLTAKPHLAKSDTPVTPAAPAVAAGVQGGAPTAAEQRQQALKDGDVNASLGIAAEQIADLFVNPTK